MQLWTDYEGVTIDGAFPLNKLLLPEGRSAFFSTANGKGEPVVLRLIECHFDEEEILARWRCLEALDHANFLKLERYGQIEIDGSPVVYAVFEKVDANLAGVLERGHLSVKDTTQLARSLTSALEMLHTHGFVHGHISAGNIFAVGDVVKLRSDCIREAAEGEVGLAAKQRDIHDLAFVLVQALTRRQSLDGVPDSAVRPPFDSIVRNGMNGTWGLEEIRAALDGRQNAAAPSASEKSGVEAAAGVGERAAVREMKMSAAAKPEEESGQWSENVVRTRMRQDIWEDENDKYFSNQTKWMGVAAIAFLLILLSLWFFNREHRRGRQVQHAAAASSLPTPVKSTAPKRQNPFLSSPASAVQPPSRTETTGDRTQWRVIAFTYSKKSDAQKKADALAQVHPDLQPSVFSPKGRAPYLVAIGGVMSKDAAYALARRSHSLGLPRDTYAQNYR
jgi:hypothetical protein